MSDTTPSHIAVSVIKNITGVVYINHNNLLCWLLYDGDEQTTPANPANPYLYQGTIQIGTTSFEASKVTMISYKTDPKLPSPNQIRIYYATYSEPSNPKPVNLRELCLTAQNGSFKNQKWFEGTKNANGQVVQTFNAEIGTEQIHAASPLKSTVTDDGIIKVFYRPATADVLRVAYTAKPGQPFSANKTWDKRDAFGAWPW